MGLARQRRGARDERRRWQVGLRFGELTRVERDVECERACAAGGPQEREESGSLRLRAVRGS